MKTTGHFDRCPVCHHRVSVRQDGLLRMHGRIGRGCKGSRRKAPTYANLDVFPWSDQS